MSYNTIYTCSNDQALRGRVTSCCAQEGEVNPSASMSMIIWNVVTSSDIEAAYASALASGNPNPGGDESVITDQMILSATQPHLPVTPPTQPTSPP